MLSNSYNRDKIETISHYMGMPLNPALIIGLQLTPTRSICLCLPELSRATCYERQMAKTNHFTHEQGRSTSKLQNAYMVAMEKWQQAKISC